jgi:hypothetical protein
VTPYSTASKHTAAHPMSMTPPTFDQMADRIRHLEDALKEIRDIAHVSEGAEFYSMVADKALKGAK